MDRRFVERAIRRRLPTLRNEVVAELVEAIFSEPPSGRSAADGASSRHTGQLRDEQNPSINEESQTNGS